MKRKIRRQVKRTDAHGKSWVPGQKGQGGEGLSHGYGGSAGAGTGASGPELRKRPKREDVTAESSKDYSPSLPTRETIAKVLR